MLRSSSFDNFQQISKDGLSIWTKVVGRWSFNVFPWFESWSSLTFENFGKMEFPFLKSRWKIIFHQLSKILKDGISIYWKVVERWSFINFPSSESWFSLTFENFEKMNFHFSESRWKMIFYQLSIVRKLIFSNFRNLEMLEFPLTAWIWNSP